MSLTHIMWVLDHSESKHGARLVLLALAEHANDEDVSYPSVGSLARRANLSERATQEALRKLVEDDELREDGSSEYGTNRYVLVGVRNLRGGAESNAGGVQNGAQNTSQTAPEPTTKSTTEPTPSARDAQGALLPDPVDEVWEHYCSTVPGKTNSRLTRETRKLIRKALDVRDITMVKAAISGLASSPHHVEGGYLQIRYAIAKLKQSETAEDRIDMMAARVRRGAQANGRPSIDELLAPWPKGTFPREQVVGKMNDVQRGLSMSNEHNQRIAAEAEAWLARSAKIIVVERKDGRIVWGKGQ